MNLFAPSTVAGDIGRALYIAGPEGRRGLALTTVIADRGLGFIVLIVIGAFAILTQPSLPLPSFVYYGAWIIPPLTLIGWFWLPQTVARLRRPESRVRKLVEQDLRPYWNDTRLIIVTSLIAAAMHVSQILTQQWLGWAIGLDIPLSYYFVFVPIVNILGLLPISFSGLGVREAGYIFFLAPLGIEGPSALALGLLSSALVLGNGVLGGLVFALWKPEGSGSPQQPAPDSPLVNED